MANNTPEERKQRRAQVQAENSRIKAERERQQKIQQGQRQGWVNPNLRTPQENRDRQLERFGLLNYQTRGQSQGDIAARFQAAGIRVNPTSNWFKGNYANAPTGVPKGVPAPAQANNGQSNVPVAFASPDQARQGQANWTDVSASDRKKILSDPNFYSTGQITKYPVYVQQQMLADADFKWDNLPWTQRLWYGISSNPALTGAVNAAAMSGFNPAATAVGGVFGLAAGHYQYDPTKEWYAQGDENKKMDTGDAVRGIFGLLNWGAEGIEKAVGVVTQGTAILTGNDPTFDPTKRNLDIRINPDFNIWNAPGEGFNPNLITGSSWDAGAITYETLMPALVEITRQHGGIGTAQKILDGEVQPEDALLLLPIVQIWDLVTNPEKYKGSEYVLGAADPVAIQQTYYERIQEAEERIQKGEDYRTVMMEMQNGILAQVGDLVGQAGADPLNMVGKTQTTAGYVIAKVTGDDVAANAFAQSSRGGKPGVFDARTRLQNTINTPDANAPKFTELGWMSRAMSGLTKTGEVAAGPLSRKGLLDYTPPKNKASAFVDAVKNYTPEARARLGQDLLLRNLGGIMSSYFNGVDVEGFAKWWSAFSKGDMTQAANLSRAMSNAPEFYTVLPAAKKFDISGQLAAWQAADAPRADLTRIADALGENPMSLIESLVKREDGAAVLQERLRAKSNAVTMSILSDIQAGRLDLGVLTEASKGFADGSVPFHPGQWMANTLNAIKDHYDTWAIDNFKLDAESRKVLFRVSSILKSAQSILLLGANPGYMISNVLPTMVTRAAAGVFGYMTPGAIDDYMNRMGFDMKDGFAPNRLDEGVGPGGIVDQARPQGDAIRQATRGKGWLTNVENVLGRIGSAMPFNKGSRLLEGYEGRQGQVLGIKRFMGEAWRRGKGFRELPKGLVDELTRVAGRRAVDILYSHIEAGLTKDEITNIVSQGSRQVQARSLIHQAAQDMNIPASQAAAMLEQLGVLDALDHAMKNARTDGEIRGAFERAKKEALTAVDRQAALDAAARIEHVANRLNTEGMKAITDIVLDTESMGIDGWLEHYDRMGKAAEEVDFINDPDARSAYWSLKYAESAASRRRFNAHKGSVYIGLVKAIGLEDNPNGRAILSTIADTDRAIDNAYRVLRDARDGHYEKFAKDWDNPRRQAVIPDLDKLIENTWKDATRTELENSAKLGELLGQQYDAMFGIEAGEAARQAWEQITAFRKEMTERRDDFRKKVKGLTAGERRRLSAEFWGKTHKYMIVEMARIKTEAIAKLDKIARGKGGDATPQGAQPDPTQPSGGAPNAEMDALRIAAEERYKAQQAKISAVWDIAEQYGYSRENTQGLYGLLGSLKKEEYGGDPTFTGGLKEAADKWTPDQIDTILEQRRQVKDAEDVSRIAARNMEYNRTMNEAIANTAKRMVSENTPLIEAIRRHGGLDWKYVEQVTGEKKPPINQRSIFSKSGKNRWGLDEMARILADDGYPIDLDSIEDPGGIQQTVDLIQRAQRGEQIFPMGSTRGEALLDANLARAEADYIERIAGEDAFDPDAWITGMMDAFDNLNSARLNELIEQVPDELLDQPASLTETYREYIERSTQEVDTQLRTEAERMSIAEAMTRSEEAVKAQQETADTSFTRQRFEESLTDVFNLTEQEASAVMEVTDAAAKWYANATQTDEGAFYRDYIEDVQKAGKIDLAQQAFHGSPYKFDKFTLDKIGSGEGEQVYGWGLYFAGNKAVAEHYRQRLAADPEIQRINKRLGEVAREMDANKSSTWQTRNEKGAALAEEYNSLLTERNVLAEGQHELGQTYKVEIPDDGYLLWDKPLSEQPKIQEFVRSQPESFLDYFEDRESNGKGFYKALEVWLGDESYPNPKAASMYLKDMGINGIKYADEGSRADAANLPYVVSVYIDGEFRSNVKMSSFESAQGYLKEITDKGWAGEIKENPDITHNYVIFDDAAIDILETYYQADTQPGATPNPKGGVKFTDEGKAIIRAWDKADVTTVIHENAHIFRRMMKDVAERTGNKQVARDMAVLENWAGVKNGEWTRAAEEKFARGFERYLADGTAPTPKLKAVFQQIKKWMLDIYRNIAGSPIDIDLTPQVKEVFDRLLTGEVEAKRMDVGDMLLQMGFDPKTYYMDIDGSVKRRGDVNIRIDKRQAGAQAESVLSGLGDRVKQLKQVARPAGIDVDPNIPAPKRGTPAHTMTYDEFKAMLYDDQKARAQRTLDRLTPENTPEWTTYEQYKAKLEAQRDRNYLVPETYGNPREKWMQAVEQALMDGLPVKDEIKQAYYEGKKGRSEMPPTMLFQDADPRMPLGGYEETAGWMPHSDVMNEGWRDHVAPLLDKMQDVAIRNLNEPTMDGAYRDLSPEGQQALRNYLAGVQQDLASTKMSALRWGAEKRDNVMLNYSKRTGLDQMLDLVFPYQFFYTRSMMTWAMRAADNPAILSNYARLRNQQDRYENNLPERLRGKMRIPAAWMPDWMGDALYIDPLSVLFTPHNFLRPFEQMMKDENYQTIEAERILQEWAADESVPQEQIVEAVKTRSGDLWEKALAEAKVRRESEISNPLDFVTATFGPAWYLSTPAKMLGLGKDGPETITELPLTRTARALDTVTNDTWAEPFGNLVGLLAKPEEKFREANNMPEFGEYGDYYIDRQLANMVSEGLITPEDAQIAMIEREGETFEQARERVKMELAMRVPLMGAIYAGTHGENVWDGMWQAAKALPASLFGAGLLPEGELHYRGLKDDWNEAWKRRDAGDTEAINRFFDEHPEYEAYLAKGKEPEDQLRSFLIGQIWDGYMGLGETDRKLASAELGGDFRSSFLDKETRSYDTLDVETLTQWAQLLNKRVPKTEQTLPAIENPLPQINYFAPEVTEITDKYFAQRKQLHPNYYEVEREYYDKPRSEQRAFLLAHPELKAYWDWKRGWYDRYPELVPVFKGEVFKRVEFDTWNPLLMEYVAHYAYAGEDLPPGAYKALEQQWIQEGRPRESVEDWLKLDVAPALLYD